MAPHMGSPQHKHFAEIPNGALDLIESSKVKDVWNKNLMNISQPITFDRAVMTYEIVNQLCPEGLLISKYYTRNGRDLHVQKGLF